MIRFRVLGTPVTQGSKRAFVNKRTGRPVVVEQAKGHASWREAVRAEAQRIAETTEPFSAGLGPTRERVGVHLRFEVQRPASAPKRKRTWPIGARSGDIDKLTRAVLDSLTGVLFADDSQVVELVATKDYGTPGVVVELYLADELEGSLEVAL